jgi:hypothetical protein
MIIIGLVLGVFGIGFLCWLLFTLAVYALPFYAGLTAAFAAYHTGAGVVGAIIVGFLAGVATLLIGQLAFASMPSPLIRGARHGRRLLYDARPLSYRRAFPDLERHLRRDRRDLRRRYGVRPHGGNGRRPTQWPTEHVARPISAGAYGDDQRRLRCDPSSSGWRRSAATRFIPPGRG